MISPHLIVPGGLLAVAATGALLQAPRSPHADNAAIQPAPFRPSATVAEDRYGGVARAVAPAAGYFRVQQVGDRWMFVTPEGNGLWMLGVFAVMYSGSIDDLGSTGESRVIAKYGGGADWQKRWRVHTAKRLKNWGFNTIGEYHHMALRGAGPDPNPDPIPYIHIIRPAFYGLDNRWGLGRGPFKDLIHGTDARFYGYRGAQSPDFFDPNFEAYVDGLMRNDDGLRYGNIGSPWMLGIAMDDSDSLFGFGPGPDLPAARQHPHLGWLALVTNFEQASSPWVSSYADRKVYTKYGLRDLLARKYGTVAALNAAWRSSYSTFDSAGGWGAGTGLLDENGRHPWVGSERDEMVGAPAAVKADLDEFLYLYARQYFTVMAAAMRRHAPQHLVLGPASLNGWGGLTRKEILRAAGEAVDVVQCNIRDPRALALTSRYVGNKPLVTWDTIVANPDSALWRYPNPTVQPQWPPTARSQAERGEIYARRIEFLFNGVSAAGIHPVAGIKFWAWGDHWGEKVNFGLVSFSENAYDGWEAVRARRTDLWGFPTGAEERDYGNFLSTVGESHRRVKEALAGLGARRGNP